MSPECMASWKELPDGGDDAPSFRAVCGKQGCPSSLGILGFVDPGGPLIAGAARREADALREEIDTVGEHLDRIARFAGSLSLPVDGSICIAKRRRYGRLRTTLAI